MNAFIHGGALSDPIELNPYKVGKSFPEGAQDNFFAPNNIHFNYMMKNLLCVVAGGIGITSFDITSAAAALKLCSYAPQSFLHGQAHKASFHSLSTQSTSAESDHILR